MKGDRNTPCQDDELVIMLASRIFKIQFRKMYYGQYFF